MFATEGLEGELAGLERTRDIRRRELDVLEGRIEEAKRAQSDAEDAWGAGAGHVSLPLFPLVASLVGTGAANFALLVGFVLILTRCDNGACNVAFLCSAVLAAACLPFSWRRGAGGQARVALRWIMIGCLALGVAEAIYGVQRIEYQYHHGY